MSDPVNERPIWEAGQYTVKVEKANASLKYGPSVGMWFHQLEGPEPGAKAWFNLVSSSPKAKEIMNERLDKMGIPGADRSAIAAALKDKQKVWDEIASRTVGLVMKVDVTKAESKKTAGVFYNYFKIVEVFTAGDALLGEAGIHGNEGTVEDTSDVLDDLLV